jgi:uncharacterized membrane protein (GlpM family)
MTALLVIRALLSGAVIVTVSELAKRNNFAAAIVHSLPLISLTALVWLYRDTRDTSLIARHCESTFWFVLPTLPLFLLLPWLLRNGFSFWTALAIGGGVTTGLYLLTIRLLAVAGFKF